MEPAPTCPQLTEVPDENGTFVPRKGSGRCQGADVSSRKRGLKPPSFASRTADRRERLILSTLPPVAASGRETNRRVTVRFVLCNPGGTFLPQAGIFNLLSAICYLLFVILNE